jgi:hypothetical protein
MSAIRQISSLPRGHLAGLVVSNNATDVVNDIDIAVGECRSDDNTANMVLATPLTKRIDAAWVAGTNQGGLDTGTVADIVTYHFFLIKNPTTGVVDALFSQSLTSPTMPSGYTLKRRLLSIKRDVANLGGLWQFRQLPGDYFQTVNTITDLSAGPAVSSSTFTMYLTSLPVGFKILCHLNVRAIFTVAGQCVTITDLDTTGTNGGAIWSQVANLNITTEMIIWSNNSASHRHQTGGGGGNVNWFAIMLGFYDPRGKS